MVSTVSCVSVSGDYIGPDPPSFAIKEKPLQRSGSVLIGLMFPVLELRQVIVEHLSSVCIGRVFGIWHVRKQKVEQRFLGGVNKLPVCVAPLTVIFVKAAIDFAANHGVVAKRHAAALAK